MSAVLEGTSSNNEEDESVLLAEIEELKKKRPRALTEKQKTDILVAYRSLQVEDLKRKKMRPGRKCGKGNNQRRVSSVLGYSSKTVGLTYRDWNRKQEIKVAVAAANHKPKRQQIPKSKQVLLSVRALVRQQRANSERVVARHILDLMRERSWIDVDETDPEVTRQLYQLKRQQLFDTVATLRKKKLKAYVDTVEPEVVQLEKQQGHEVLYTPPYHCDLQSIEMVWSQVKGDVGRQYDLSTTMVIVKQRLEAAFEHLNADTTGRIENLYAHVRKIEKEYMETDDNEEYSNSKDDAASDMSDSDVESVEDQEDPSHSESSSSSDDVDSESDTDEM
eukprot:Em0021g579a